MSCSMTFWFTDEQKQNRRDTYVRMNRCASILFPASSALSHTSSTCSCAVPIKMNAFYYCFISSHLREKWPLCLSAFLSNETHYSKGSDSLLSKYLQRSTKFLLVVQLVLAVVVPHSKGTRLIIAFISSSSHCREKWLLLSFFFKLSKTHHIQRFIIPR